MKLKSLLSAALLLVFVLALLPVITYAASTPSLSLNALVQDQSATIRLANMPADTRYEVLMRWNNLSDAKWVLVDTQSSGKGGTYLETYAIPTGLRGASFIDLLIRRKSDQAQIATLLFFNATEGVQPVVTPGAVYTGFPTFAILSVEKDKKVTVQVYNLPARQTFEVRMGLLGTRGLKGEKITTFESGTDAYPKLSFDIPKALQGQPAIALRLESTTGFRYYAFNWFYNGSFTAATPTATPTGVVTPAPTATPKPPTGYTGFPTISVVKVVHDTSVTLQAANLPAGDTFDCLINFFGTRGVNGVKVSSFETGSGGKQQVTCTIPAAFKGQTQLAVRIQSPTSGYFAYNWFYNQTAP